MNTKLKSIYKHLMCCAMAGSFPHMIEAGGMRLLIYIVALFFSLQSCEEKDELEEVTPQIPVIENPEDVFEVEGATHTAGAIKQGYLFGALITYQEIDGQAIFQGDIKLSPAQLAQGGSIDNGRTSGAGNAAADHLWPNNTVYYTIDSRFSSEQKTRIEEAISAWSLNTNLSFVKSSSQRNRIKFIPSDKHASSVGMIGGEQTLELAPGFTAGIAIHEIGHAIGLFHEHSRNDRDRYVNIYWSNIISEKKHNFEKYMQLENEDGIPYFMGFDHQQFDFGSIMMYPQDAFAIDKKKPTITRKDGKPLVAQRKFPSDNDFAVIDDLYTKPFVKVNAPLALKISAGADGTVYMISKTTQDVWGNSIYKWLGDGIGWTKEQNMSATAIAVAPDGTPWVVNKSKRIYRKVGNTWEQVPGSALDIGIGANGTVWIIGTTLIDGGYKIYKKSATGWTPINGTGGIAIDVDAQGNPWVITLDKQIYRKTSQSRSLVKVTGWGYDVTGGRGNDVYMLSGVGTNHSIYKWTGSSWLKQPGQGVKIAAGQKDKVWIVKADGTVYRRD